MDGLIYLAFYVLAFALLGFFVGVMAIFRPAQLPRVLLRPTLADSERVSRARTVLVWSLVPAAIFFVIPWVDVSYFWVYLAGALSPVFVFIPLLRLR